MPRVFVPPGQLPVINGSDVHYLRDVMRLKAGDDLELFDGTGKIYQAKISNLSKDSIICSIISTALAPEPGPKITLAQALTRAGKMDFVIEKCTELGVSQIIPMTTERTITKSAKAERWQKIAKEAAEQSGRTSVPTISPLTKFTDIMKLQNQFDLAIIPWEKEAAVSLKSVLTTHPPINPSTILVLIGPEGGFSEAEVNLALEAGFTSVSLGNRILRTETAGLAALAAIQYELGSEPATERRRHVGIYSPVSESLANKKGTNPLKFPCFL